MGTVCYIFAELDEGGYVGTVVLYDGYPEHMLKQVKFMKHKDLQKDILIAGSQGGYRIFSPLTEETEILSRNSPFYVYEPEGPPEEIFYVYVKDGNENISWYDVENDKWLNIDLIGQW